MTELKKICDLLELHRIRFLNTILALKFFNRNITLNFIIKNRGVDRGRNNFPASAKKIRHIKDFIEHCPMPNSYFYALVKII